MTLQLRPVTWREARRFIAQFHRHNKPPTGAVFSIGLETDGILVGVLTAGRPTRSQDNDGYTLEVTRNTIRENIPNGASKLLGAARRAAAGLGYRRLLTRTRADEPGTSLHAAGWLPISVTTGTESWNRPGRSRSTTAVGMPKIRWETTL